MLKTISLCMIVKDEERVLERCLSSIWKVVDEIIIVDTGSKDNTKRIAEKYHCKVYEFQWIHDFSAARNFSFDKATMDYILWLDADDVLLTEDMNKLKGLKLSMDGSIDTYSMIYDYAFDERGEVKLSFRRNRLVKREKNFKWTGIVHEYIKVNGIMVDTDIHITHKREHNAGQRNLEIYRSRIKEGYILNTRDTYYYAKELFDNEIYDEGVRYFDVFLEKEDGWVEDKIASCRKVADYYYNVKDYVKCRKYCYKTFEYDLPRAEACCRLGLSYMDEHRYEEAIFWYKLATILEKPTNDWGYMEHNSWSWLPHLQLCVCYYSVGDSDASYNHNELAYKHNKEHESIISNRQFFKSLGYGVANND